MGPYVFLIFTFCSALLFVFIYRNMPETKGRSIEDIVREFGVKSSDDAVQQVEGESLVMKNTAENNGPLSSFAAGNEKPDKDPNV